MFFDWRFLGYILNWGQMSYWGITVMINILSIIPYVIADVSSTKLYNNNKLLVWLGTWLIIFIFPTLMLFIKFFLLFLLLIQSIYFIISSLIFLIFIFQGLLLRCALFLSFLCYCFRQLLPHHQLSSLITFAFSPYLYLN